MGFSDLLLGSFCTAVSLFVFYYSARFPKFISGDKELPGPSFFPRLLALFILGFGLFFLAHGLYSMIKDKRGFRFEGILKRIRPKVLLSSIAVLSTAFILQPVLNLLGTILGFTITGAFLMRLFRVKWIQSLIYSFVLAVVIYLIFRVIFKLPLPEGKIFSLLRR